MVKYQFVHVEVRNLKCILLFGPGVVSSTDPAPASLGGLSALLLQGAWGVCTVTDQQQRWQQLLFSCLIRRASGTLVVWELSVGGSGGASLSSAGPPRPRAAREHKEPGPELGTSSPLLLMWGYAVVNPGQSYWWRESNAVYELYSFINN